MPEIVIDPSLKRKIKKIRDRDMLDVVSEYCQQRKSELRKEAVKEAELAPVRWLEQNGWKYISVTGTVELRVSANSASRQRIGRGGSVYIFEIAKYHKGYKNIGLVLSSRYTSTTYRSSTTFSQRFVHASMLKQFIPVPEVVARTKGMRHPEHSLRLHHTDLLKLQMWEKTKQNVVDEWQSLIENLRSVYYDNV